MYYGFNSHNWKHKIREETSQKSLPKIFCFNSKDIRKIKGFQKPSNKKLYFTLRSNNTKYIKHFTLSLFHDQTLTEEHHNLTADILGKILYWLVYKMVW